MSSSEELNYFGNRRLTLTKNRLVEFNLLLTESQIHQSVHPLTFIFSFYCYTKLSSSVLLFSADSSPSTHLLFLQYFPQSQLRILFLRFGYICRLREKETTVVQHNSFSFDYEKLYQKCSCESASKWASQIPFVYFTGSGKKNIRENYILCLLLCGMIGNSGTGAFIALEPLILIALLNHYGMRAICMQAL